MSFVRSPTHRSRPGAIAALDGLASRRLGFQRMVQATKSRDRKMSAITGGALAMGADRVPIRNEGRDTTVNVVTSAPPPPAAVIKPPVYAPPSAVVPPPRPTVPPPVAVIPPPTVTPPPPSPIPGPITTVIGGGGRATGAGTTTSTTVVPAGSPVPVTKPPMTLPPLPGIPDIPDVVDVEDNTTKYLMWAGGAALVAYLLFGRRSS